MNDEHLNQEQTASRLGLTSRQVQNLRRDHGMPADVEKGRVSYHWPTVQRWYLDFKIAEAFKRARANNGGDEEKALRLRKLEIENEIAEFRLARERASYATPDDLERILQELLTPLRARILQLPTKWSPRLKACRTTGQVADLLQTLSRELLDELRNGNDPDPPQRARRAKKARKKRG